MQKTPSYNYNYPSVTAWWRTYDDDDDDDDDDGDDDSVKCQWLGANFCFFLNAV